jgi:S-formylglutathione hydrolase FrmB
VDRLILPTSLRTRRLLWRSPLLSVVAVIAAGVVSAAPAEGARIVTWKTNSRFVDPARVVFGQPPMCGCTPHAGDHLPVNVYLPDGYNGRRRFPVLYLLHRAGGAYDSWLRVPAFPHDRGADLRRTAAGFPGIIVMPDGGSFGYYSNWWNGGRRGAPGWERYHLDELTRLVERRLRVRRGRRFHAIAGFSMGGFGAAFYASQRPGYFGLAASLSGVVSLRRHRTSGAIRAALGDPIAQQFYWRGHDPVALARNLRWTRLYVRVGDGIPRGAVEEGDINSILDERTLRGDAKEFVAAARRVGGPLRFEIKPGIHDALNNRRSLADALRWARRAFRKALPDRPAHWSYRTVAKHSKAFGFRFSFRTAPSELIGFRLRGRRLAASGSGTVKVRTPGGTRFTAKLPFRRRVRHSR